MKIENGRKHTLTNFSAVKKGGEVVESDHKPLVMEVKIDIPSQRKEKIEIMNFKDSNSQEVFKDITTKTKAFTQCFTNVQPVLEQADKWLNTVQSYCKKAFKLIRIRSRKIKSSGADKLISERNNMIKNGIMDTSKIDARIADIISEEDMKKACMFKKYTDTRQSGAVSDMWKLKKQLFPKKLVSLPSAKYNYQNQIISHPKDLTKSLGEEYGKVRLRMRPTHPLLIKSKSIRKNIIKTKLLIEGRRKTEHLKI